GDLGVEMVGALGQRRGRDVDIGGTDIADRQGHGAAQDRTCTRLLYSDAWHSYAVAYSHSYGRRGIVGESVISDRAGDAADVVRHLGDGRRILRGGVHRAGVFPLSLHDALPIFGDLGVEMVGALGQRRGRDVDIGGTDIADRQGHGAA